MKIYTKTGDLGMTGLYGGTRVSKDDLRIDSYGTVDELNSFLGLIRNQKIDKHSFDTIIEIQKNLFVVGAVLATREESKILKNGSNRLGKTKISNKMINFLETEIDLIDTKLPAMTHFVLPGGHTSVSFCHIARAVCRRAERLVVALAKQEEIEVEVIVYLNRLSDYLFVLARKLTFDNKVKEIKWIP